MLSVVLYSISQMHVKVDMVGLAISDCLIKVHCTLLIGKSRVAPLKFFSIPRLELTAATLSVKISTMLKNELDIHVDDEIFWTDSKVVLGYINGDVRRFKVFVANRVQQKRDHTSPKQ